MLRPTTIDQYSGGDALLPCRYLVSGEGIFQIILFSFEAREAGCLLSSQLSGTRLVNLGSKMLKESYFFCICDALSDFCCKLHFNIGENLEAVSHGSDAGELQVEEPGGP